MFRRLWQAAHHSWNTAWPPVTGASSARATGTSSAPDTRIALAIADERAPAGRVFADQLAQHGVPVRLMRGNVNAVWDELHQRWGGRPAAITGLTVERPLFLLAMMARGYDL